MGTSRVRWVVLGVDKLEHGFVGGWTAQGSDRYARIATRDIVRMQQLVSLCRSKQTLERHCGGTSQPRRSTEQNEPNALICLRVSFKTRVNMLGDLQILSLEPVSIQDLPVQTNSKQLFTLSSRMTQG